MADSPLMWSLSPWPKHKELKFLLLEAVAHNIAEAILAKFAVEEVTVRARKHSVPLAGMIDYTEVEITRNRREV